MSDDTPASAVYGECGHELGTLTGPIRGIAVWCGECGEHVAVAPPS